MEFPRWEYHALYGARLFKTSAELDAAGEGWFDSPALVGGISFESPQPEAPKEPVKRGPGRPRKVPNESH